MEISDLILKWAIPFVLVGATAIPLIKYQLKESKDAIKEMDEKFSCKTNDLEKEISSVRSENMKLISEVLERNSADRDRILETIADRFVSSLDSVTQATSKVDESFRRVHERLDEIMETNTTNIRDLERFM